MKKKLIFLKIVNKKIEIILYFLCKDFLITGHGYTYLINSRNLSNK